MDQQSETAHLLRQLRDEVQTQTQMLKAMREEAERTQREDKEKLEETMRRQDVITAQQKRLIVGMVLFFALVGLAVGATLTSFLLGSK
ncbi:MAG: hypothetical protein ACJ8F7_21925 [Gemmataceae bacterium]